MFWSLENCHVSASTAPGHANVKGKELIQCLIVVQHLLPHLQFSQKLQRTSMKNFVTAFLEAHFNFLKHGFGAECNSTYAEASFSLLLSLKEYFNFDVFLNIRTEVCVKRLI